MRKFEVVAPAYNESKNLPAFVARIRQVAEEGQLSPEEFQFIIVNNGSLDDSAQILESLKNTDCGKWFRVVTVAVNQGYGYGILQGLLSTTAPIIGWTHADLQCDPQNAIKAYELANATQSKLLVKGTRYGRQLKDRFVSFVFLLFSRVILGLDISELNAQPKVFRRELLEKLQACPHSFAFDLYALFIAKKNGYNFMEVPVLFPPRINGFSNWAASFLGRHRTIIAMILYMYELRKKEGRL